MITLRNWTAKRAGGRITLAGYNVDADLNPFVKVVGIDIITGNSASGITATHKSGVTYKLVA